MKLQRQHCKSANWSEAWQCRNIENMLGSVRIPCNRWQNFGSGGARESRGMPAFKGVLKREQLPALQAYILSRAAAAANPAK